MEDDSQIPDFQQEHAKGSRFDSNTAIDPDQGSPTETRAVFYEPELYDIEDLPVNLSGQNQSAQLVKPYAIEEPDEESISEPESEQTSTEQRQPRSWEDLVNSMEDLCCDSDNSNAGVISAKRGRKRKSTNVYNMANVSPSGQSSGSGSVPDAQYQRPSLSPKRPRKKGEQSKDIPVNLKAAQRHRMRRRRALSGSSTTSISTDTSGINFTNGTPIPDAMDLD
ncbi:hypothetical protein BDV06DRAFT_226420 [Aspergillus oleicola]